MAAMATTMPRPSLLKWLIWHPSLWSVIDDLHNLYSVFTGRSLLGKGPLLFLVTQRKPQPGAECKRKRWVTDRPDVLLA
jgi:hypothetical protein